MVQEVLEHLAPSRGGLFIDCTVGLGGHARAIVDAGASTVIGFDRDPQALERARETLSEVGDKVELVHADYRRFEDVLNARGVGPVAGILADLGVSSLQLDAPGRGFSFRRDEPLDMRGPRPPHRDGGGSPAQAARDRSAGLSSGDDAATQLM